MNIKMLDVRMKPRPAANFFGVAKINGCFRFNFFEINFAVNEYREGKFVNERTPKSIVKTTIKVIELKFAAKIKVKMVKNEIIRVTFSSA